MLAFLLDIAYLIALVAATPWLVYKAITSGKYRAGWREKLWGAVPRREGDRPCLWFHAVSVGEVLLLRRVVAEFVRRRPDVDVVISTTTNTGMEVARQHFSQHIVTYFPFDFSWAVGRAIARLRPNVIALAELELWPNFVAAAERAGASVSVINGRMSPRSRRGYGRIRWLMRRLLGRVDAFALQTAEYAKRFIEIGAPADRVVVTGSVKYDGVETNRDNAATARLRELFGLRPNELVWVAGSTAEPEERIVLDSFEKLRVSHPLLRLIVVPRQKDQFDKVARQIEARGLKLVRRSELQQSVVCGRSSVATDNGPRTTYSQSTGAVILVNSLGELSAVWGLADIAFVGGSFAPRGGQNMIEPAGYGAAVLFGPGVWNFQDTVNHLLACDGAIQISKPDELAPQIESLLRDPERRAALGAAAREFVLTQQGATAQTIDLLDHLLPPRSMLNRLAA